MYVYIFIYIYKDIIVRVKILIIEKLRTYNGRPFNEIIHVYIYIYTELIPL